jgi:tripartite-type tricarboxylate transporter receptor subunit TctC
MIPRRLLLGALAAPVAARAQPMGAWPDRPLRMVIPWPPGGGNDIVGRIFADQLGKRLGQPVVVENRGGSNGVLGAEVVAKAKPDGFTLMFHSVTSHVVNAALFARLPYDSFRDFIPAALPGYSALAIEVSPKLGIASFADLIARIRAAPGTYSYASFGNGSAAHLAGEMLKQRLGLDMVHIPYRGGAAALTDVISGAVPINIGGINTTAAAIRGGLVLPLAVTGLQRSAMLPAVPSVAEVTALKDFEVGVTYALWLPAGTPPPIVDRVAADCAAIMADPVALAPLLENGVEPLPPLDAGQRMARVMQEAELLGRVARESRVTIE